MIDRREFNESTDLTMDSIFEWGMNQYAEEIHNISQSATKEMTIEKVSSLKLSFFCELMVGASHCNNIPSYKDGNILSS